MGSQTRLTIPGAEQRPRVHGPDVRRLAGLAKVRTDSMVTLD